MLMILSAITPSPTQRVIPSSPLSRQRLRPCRRLATLMRPSHPVRHFWPLRNQRLLCSRLRLGLLVERLGMQTRLWALHANAYDYTAVHPNATARQMQRYETVFKSTIYETEHPVVQVNPLSGERAIVLGYFVRRLLGVGAADSGHLFAMLQDHVTRLENMVRWRWSVGDVVIWDNRATQHKAIDDYGEERRIVRRVTVDGPVSVGIDGRHGTRRSSAAQVTAAA